LLNFWEKLRLAQYNNEHQQMTIWKAAFINYDTEKFRSLQALKIVSKAED
jgi:hypothetical protein